MTIPMAMSFVPVTIANGTALTPQVNIGPELLCGIVMPAAWTAAGLSLQASPDGGTTFYEVANAAGLLALTVAAGQWLVLDPTLYRGLFALKVRSGTAGSPVNQGADRILTLVTRPLP